MAKASRESLLHSGQSLLREWNLDDGAGAAELRGVLGRDPAADLAVAERLGDLTGEDSVALLQEIESGASDKLVRKEAKRSLYRLEQRGVAIPHAEAAGAAALAVAAPEIEGFVSLVDGHGDQIVWLTRSGGGVLWHLSAVINDPEGLREVDVIETSRKSLRAMRTALEERHDLRMIACDWRYCDFLIDRAFHWARERGVNAGDYPGLRARITREPVQECAPLIRSHYDAPAILAESQLLQDSAKLLAQPELRTWVLGTEVLQAYIDSCQEILESPLVLSDEQRMERVEDLSQRAVTEVFGGALQASWVRRLEALAFVFHATGRGAQAQAAFAAALALEKSEDGGRGVPLLEILTRTCLTAYIRFALERRAQAEAGDDPHDHEHGEDCDHDH